MQPAPSPGRRPSRPSDTLQKHVPAVLKMYEIVEQASREESQVFFEFTEIAMQFSWVVLFSVVFPLGPICALFNNIVELRSDVFKLCEVERRPIPRASNGIGTWESILVWTTRIALPVTLGIIFISYDS